MRNITTRARAVAIAVVSALLTAAAGEAQAQQATITGRVLSDFGTALEGANVYISDLAISVGTNAQGNFTITIPEARVQGQQVNLRVRAIGYTPDVRPIRITAGTQTVNFQLKQDVNRLDEIVVTGVVEGVERAKVPFAIARLSTEEMPVPALDPIMQLAGKVPGVRIGKGSGRPGAGTEIMMRGPTSINGTGRDRSPLIIVDGAIMNVGSSSMGGMNGGGSGGLEDLGSMDIESIEIVKGAAGASLYGTRAANGVIVIKTKRGAATDGVKFNVRTEYGLSDLNSISYGMPLNHQLQLDETGTRFCVQTSGNIPSCARTVDWMTEIMRINNVNADTTRNPQSLQWNNPAASGGELQNVFQAQIWPGRYYDMLAQILRPNPTTLSSVDASGKVGNVRFYVSGSYTNEQGAIKGLNGSEQRRGRVNIDYDARSDMLISVSTLFDNGITDQRVGGSSNGSIFGQALRGAAIGTDYSARDTLGRYLVRGGGASLRSPTGNGGGTFLYDSENALDTRTTNRFLGNITGSYFPVSWMTLEGVFAYDNRDRLDKSYLVKGYRTFAISTANNNGNMQFGNRTEESVNAGLTATFRKQLRSDLNGKLIVRSLYDQSSFIANNSGGQQFFTKDVYTTSNLSTNKTATSSSETVKNTGYLAGGTLDYKDRYIFDGTFRYDGSSLFGADTRWAPFNRVSAVWRVSQESFWSSVPYVSDFRLRGSRGTAGSTPRFNAQYETFTVDATGIRLGQAGNNALKPETTTEYEFGTDFTLLNRFGFEVTRAISKTEDQILLVNTPATLGFAQRWQNAGTLENSTWELGVTVPVINTRDLQWSMRGTWDRTRTVVSELFAPEYVQDANTAQGTGTFFRITADPHPTFNGRDVTNGFQGNRFGNIWGRKFYKKCSDLRSELQPFCGEGKDFQVNNQGYLVWVGAGNSWKDGITKNLWTTRLDNCTVANPDYQKCMAAGQSPFGPAPLYWGMPIIDRPLAGENGAGVGIKQILGNVFPDFRFSYSNNVQYKKFNLYALLDGTIGNDVYNQGEGWGLLDLSSAHFDQRGASVENAKPLGYSWRGGPSESTGIGGFYDLLEPNNYVLEDASYAKLREVSLSYRVGAVRGVGDWTVGLIGRNLFTFTNYTGLDPEVGCGVTLAGGCGGGGSNTQGAGNSAFINQVDAFGFPTLRTFTLSLSTRF
ncbi:MAG TPA: SusC/RagA family TonB-linked outer membrane protein [Gemmatimonadaceae bacterium]|nr:SusC/RagA family TonB-linked outer membrane protein [Gemmatimonadaceae bacterium]